MPGIPGPPRQRQEDTLGLLLRSVAESVSFRFGVRLSQSADPLLKSTKFPFQHPGCADVTALHLSSQGSSTSSLHGQPLRCTGTTYLKIKLLLKLEKGFWSPCTHPVGMFWNLEWLCPVLPTWQLLADPSWLLWILRVTPVNTEGTCEITAGPWWALWKEGSWYLEEWNQRPCPTSGNCHRVVPSAQLPFQGLPHLFLFLS